MRRSRNSQRSGGGRRKSIETNTLRKRRSEKVPGPSRYIYFVTENADQMEGRGPQVPVAYFENRDDAIEASRGRGVMGVGDGEVQNVRVYSSLSEWKRETSGKARQEALAKLTEDERRILGLE